MIVRILLLADATQARSLGILGTFSIIVCDTWKEANQPEKDEGIVQVFLMGKA